MSILHQFLSKIRKCYFCSLLKHVVKAPSSGHVHELQITAGQQVSDSSFLFSVQVSHLHLNIFDTG